MEMPGNSDAMINIGCWNSPTAPTLHSQTQCSQKNTAGKHRYRKESRKPTVGSSYRKREKKSSATLFFSHHVSLPLHISGLIFYPTVVLVPGLSVLQQNLSFPLKTKNKKNQHQVQTCAVIVFLEKMCVRACKSCATQMVVGPTAAGWEEHQV